MENLKKSSLFFRLTIFFFVFLFNYSFVIGYFFIKSAIKYEREVTQKLNKDIANQIVKDASPFLNGTVNESKVQDLMHYLMAVNPSIEIYVLCPEGRILTYVAPHKVVKLSEVSLDPILKFIESKGEKFIMGDDPKNPGNNKIFSAAPVIESGNLLGYVYVILASQEQDGISANIQNSSLLQFSVKTFSIVLIVSLIIGTIVFSIYTKNIKLIIESFKQYKSGNLKARINLPSSNTEYTIIEKTFNEMADSLEQKIAQINEVDNMRKELIANISHDLRTPVAAILGYTELLLDKNEKLDAQERIKYLSIIDLNTQKMQKQIQDLFDLSKLESLHYKLRLEPIHLGELVTDIANKYKLIANKNGINLNTLFSKDIPLIQADIALMDRALQNLIDNALKFSKSGDTVNLEIGYDKENLTISVADTGQGISPTELPFIFDRYKTGSKNESNSTGLGLAIVKKIVELHNFKIEVISTEMKGTTFTIYIPTTN